MNWSSSQKSLRRKKKTSTCQCVRVEASRSTSKRSRMALTRSNLVGCSEGPAASEAYLQTDTNWRVARNSKDSSQTKPSEIQSQGEAAPWIRCKLRDHREDFSVKSQNQSRFCWNTTGSSKIFVSLKADLIKWFLIKLRKRCCGKSCLRRQLSKITSMARFGCYLPGLRTWWAWLTTKTTTSNSETSVANTQTPASTRLSWTLLVHSQMILLKASSSALSL